MSRRLSLEALEPREVPAAIAALDPSFDADGRASLAGVPFTGVALQNLPSIPGGGRIVAVGTSVGDFVVARYNPDGSLDKTFGTNGTRRIDIGGTDQATAVAVDSSGRIIVVGSASSGANMVVVRLTANGALDTSFDRDGIVTIDFGGTEVANAVAIDSAGNIVVAGSTGTDFAVARLTPAAGALDTSFGTGGKKTIDFGGTDVVNGVAIQSNGAIVLAGSNGNDFAFARLNGSNGSLDTSFNSTGKFTLNMGGVDVARDVIIDASGRIVAVGSNGSDMAVVRLAGSNGGLDPSFNGTGKITVDISGADDARSVQLQSDGRILVVGDTGNNASDTAIVRLTTAGKLDTSFNGTGKLTYDVTGTTKLDIGTASVLSPQGRLIVAGKGGGGMVDGILTRVPVQLEDSSTLAVGGSLNGRATLYTPNSATGQYGAVAAATVAVFGTTTANVRTATGDVNGDGVEDTVLVTGPGTPIRVAVVSGKDNSTILLQPTDPFGGNFTGGGFVSVGDFDLDGRSDIVVTPDQGGGPRVVIFSVVNGTGIGRANFLGINDPNFRGGARTAVGDINADGIPDLVVAAGFQGGPRISVYGGNTLFSAPSNNLVGDFLAFDASLRNGSYVAIGDVNGDGYGDLYFGAGPGGAPRILGISGKKLVQSGPDAALATPMSSFFLAGNASNRGGVRVTTTDVNGDNKADLVAGTGEGLGSFVRLYTGATITSTNEPSGAQTLDPFAGAVLANGVFVG
jgi:uncharacterized delta-60 repeat protein